MPAPEQVVAAPSLRVHLDLPPEQLVWEVTGVLKDRGGITPFWPFKTDRACKHDILVIRVREPPTVVAPGDAPLRLAARVVALVPDDGDDALLNAARAGAWAAVPEAELGAGLLIAVRRVAAGECPLLEAAASRPRLAAAVIGDVRSAFEIARGTPPRNPLSSRETDMLRLVADGITNRVIAQRLNLSEQTVKNYLSTIFAKTGASRRAQAAAMAIRRGWLPPE